MEWLSATTHDFGEVKTGTIASHTFEFKNISDTPLTIDNVRLTCGCTTSDWSGAVVPPGEKGSIPIEFDAAKPGWFSKKITVFFTGQRQPEKLYIEGYVE